jgi:hypothetical protein
MSSDTRPARPQPERVTTWTFHSADHPEPTARARAEDREADLVRRLVVLEERHAIAPSELTGREVAELTAKLDELRAEIDDLRSGSETRD